MPCSTGIICNATSLCYRMQFHSHARSTFTHSKRTCIRLRLPYDQHASSSGSCAALSAAGQMTAALDMPCAASCCQTPVTLLSIRLYIRPEPGSRPWNTVPAVITLYPACTLMYRYAYAACCMLLYDAVKAATGPRTLRACWSTGSSVTPACFQRLAAARYQAGVVTLAVALT